MLYTLYIMKMTHIVDKFHGTETRVRAGLGEIRSITENRQASLQKALCGMDDSSCGDSAGARGSYYTLTPHQVPGTGDIAWEVDIACDAAC